MAQKELTWNLASIYPSLDSEAYRRDKEALVHLSQSLLEELDRESAGTGPQDSLDWLAPLLTSLDRLSDLAENLESYVYALWSAETSDEVAQGEMDDIESRKLGVKEVFVRFRAIFAEREGGWTTLDDDDRLELYRFWLTEQQHWGKRQMTPGEESLAADLQRSGGDAWDRLHGKMTSTLSGHWESKPRTLTQLRAMAYDADRRVRRRAWEEETRLLEGAELPLAAALNGVKGTTVSLNQRRGWGSTLEKSLFQNRLSRQGLDAMLGAMTESLPMFRRYFRGKAKCLGLDRLSWYDLFAPLGGQNQMWSWENTTEFIPRMFDTLSIRMGDFARRAFAERWIDVHPRSGKVGGAYCIYFPLAQESRILCNFDGSFDSVSTVAHELGHAWHGEVMKDVNGVNRDYPMTLAETASIFAETLVFRAALSDTAKGERLGILDTHLMGASQVIVDILSRFHFESNLMRARPAGELSPREMSEMMLDAQDRSYGDALQAEERHPWMWAVKGHYYSPDMAFYNFPYAFGQLFATGLYACFREEGPDFAQRYTELLQGTGSDDAAGVARAMGFDIEAPDFWRRGLSEVGEVIDEFLTEAESERVG